MKILLKNGNVIDSANNRAGKFDILIENGEITHISENLPTLSISEGKVIDCFGLTVIPGIFDMHTHLRDPGQTHKENLQTGSEAASAGGVTAIVCMPNTTPVLDSPEIISDIVERSRMAKVKIYPCAAITDGLQGECLCNFGDFDALKNAGAVALSDDGRPVENSRIMMEAMALASKAGLRVISHCEDLNIVGKGIINEGAVSEKLNIHGISRTSENISTMREICIANDLKAHIHIAHVSTKEAVEYIKTAKNLGINVTCETAPHYFTLTDCELLKQDADYRMNPPLREPDDVSAVTAALENGIIDCIASDHAPHTQSEKADFLTAPNGVVGLETLLSVTLTQLYHTGRLSISKIVELLCVNPRRILGIDGGGFNVGSHADIAIVDLNEEWIVEPELLHSKSKNTCFKGMRLKGKVKYTLVNGEIVYVRL